jgi:hypothetical protein
MNKDKCEYEQKYKEKYKENLNKDIDKILEKYKEKPYCNDVWYSNFYSNFGFQKDINWISLRGCCNCKEMVEIIEYLKNKNANSNLFFKCDSTTKFTTSMIGYKTLYVGIKR